YRRSMTAAISLNPGKTGAHRAPLQLLDLSFSRSFAGLPEAPAVESLQSRRDHGHIDVRAYDAIGRLYAGGARELRAGRRERQGHGEGGSRAAHHDRTGRTW